MSNNQNELIHEIWIEFFWNWVKKISVSGYYWTSLLYYFAIFRYMLSRLSSRSRVILKSLNLSTNVMCLYLIRKSIFDGTILERYLEKSVAFVLLQFTASRLWSNQVNIFFRSSESTDEVNVFESAEKYNVVSSANRTNSDCKWRKQRWLMQRMKRCGPRIDPCGTSIALHDFSDLTPFNWTMNEPSPGKSTTWWNYM